MTNPIIEARIMGLSESIGLMHFAKSIFYDGENDIAKRICVRFENEVCDRIEELRRSDKYATKA